MSMTITIGWDERDAHGVGATVYDEVDGPLSS
jgi:hypothetical protein